MANVINSELEFNEHINKMTPDEIVKFIAREQFYERRKLDDFCDRFTKVEQEHNDNIKRASENMQPCGYTSSINNSKRDKAIGAGVSAAGLISLYSIIKPILAHWQIYI